VDDPGSLGSMFGLSTSAPARTAGIRTKYVALFFFCCTDKSVWYRGFADGYSSVYGFGATQFEVLTFEEMHVILSHVAICLGVRQSFPGSRISSRISDLLSCPAPRSGTDASGHEEKII